MSLMRGGSKDRVILSEGLGGVALHPTQRAGIHELEWPPGAIMRLQ